MKIELKDLDFHYTLEIDMNDKGSQMLRISTESDDNTICLDKDGISQLIRVLNFMKGEMQ